MQDRPLRIALVGDFNPEVTAHRAIPLALEQSARDLDIQVEPVWTGSETLADAATLDADGIWCVPASPYRSTQGALNAIRFARENGVPFLGTCGGFQHAVLEIARNVLGWDDAVHAETDPDSGRAVIVPLACSLVEQSGGIRLLPDSKIAEAYGSESITEEYHCRYGMAADVQETLSGIGVRFVAWDDQGDVRGIEMEGHPFFVATLFQHERAVLKGRLTPLVTAFLAAV